MKRFLILGLLAVFAATAFAGGKAEQGDITVLGMDSPLYELAIGAFQRQYPGVNVRVLSVDQTTGETISMDALIAAGTPPDIYLDFVGRASKYKVKEFAQRLDIDTSLFVPSLMKWGMIGDEVYGIPMPAPGQAMVLNLDILDEIGYTVPDEWTTDDFLDMARLSRDHGYHATALFAANPSADYLWVNWFGSFGAEFYTDGYAESALNTTAGLRSFEWLDMLVREGFVPDRPEVITDDDALEIWQTGTVAAMPIRPSWVPYYIGQAVDQGVIPEAFRTQIVEFPRGPGVEGVPTVGAGSMLIIHKTDDPVRARMLTDLVLLVAGKDIQTIIVAGGHAPSRVDVTAVSDRVGEDVVRRLADTYGWMDVGYGEPWYYEVRSALPAILRDMYTGRLTPREARDRFVAETNEIIQ